MTKPCCSYVESAMSRLKSIFDQQGKAVQLGKLLGRGGEGAVFEIVGQPDLVAKIYHPDKARERQQKDSGYGRQRVAGKGVQRGIPYCTIV